jgi:hypothetical protein
MPCSTQLFCTPCKLKWDHARVERCLSSSGVRSDVPCGLMPSVHSELIEDQRFLTFFFALNETPHCACLLTNVTESKKKRGKVLRALHWRASRRCIATELLIDSSARAVRIVVASVQVGAQHAIESQTDCTCTKLGDACEALSFVGLNNLIMKPSTFHSMCTGDRRATV